MIHPEPSALAGKTVVIRDDIKILGGKEYRVEDWWDRVSGKSWMFCEGNVACLNYAARTGFSKLPIPTDDEVLYGKIGSFGHLVHISEIVEKTAISKAEKGE